MKLNHTIILLAVFAVCLINACKDNTPAAPAPASSGAAHNHEHADPWKDVNELIAVMHPTEGNTTKGTVRFKKTADGVQITAQIEGLSANGKHAFHIHEFGDCSSADGSSAGGHYNPEGHDHGLPDKDERHAGDLGNLSADADGKATYTLTVKNITLTGEHNPIIGRGVIIHVKEDDGGQPVGNAGARIACGVIGIAKPAAPPAQ